MAKRKGRNKKKTRISKIKKFVKMHKGSKKKVKSKPARKTASKKKRR